MVSVMDIYCFECNQINNVGIHKISWYIGETKIILNVIRLL